MFWSKIKTADRYLLRSFLTAVAFLFALFLVIALVLVLFEDLDEIREYGTSFQIALAYIFLRLPHEILKVTPMIVVLATMHSVGELVRHQEMMVFYIAGYSPLRLAAPLASVLVAMVLVLFLLYENVAGPCAVKAHTLMETVIKGGQGVLTAKSGIWLPGDDDQVFYATSYLPASYELLGVSIFVFQGPGRSVSQRIDAESAKWDPKTDYWMMSNVISRDISLDGAVVREKVERSDYRIERNPSDFERYTLEPELMSRHDLAIMVNQIRQAGENPRLYLADLRIKEAFPFAVFFLGILAFGWAQLLGGVTKTSGIGAGLLMVIGYFLSLSMGKSLSNAGVIYTWLGAWAPNIIACTLIGYIYYRIQTER